MNASGKKLVGGSLPHGCCCYCFLLFAARTYKKYCKVRTSQRSSPTGNTVLVSFARSERIGDSDVWEWGGGVPTPAADAQPSEAVT